MQLPPGFRRLAGAMLVAATVGALGTAPPAAAQTAITFSLDFRPLGRHAAWYVALEKGFYKRAGLDVTIIPAQGTAQAIQSLEAGVVQLAFSDVAGLTAARANSGTTAKMVAVIYQKAPYAIFSLRSGANLTDPKQLEGLEIASGAGSFTQKVIEAFMVERGLKPSSVTFTNIDPSARVGMLAAKKIPAIETFVMSRPGIIKAVGDDEARTFLLADHGLKLYSNGILARADYLKSNPEIVKGFIAAALNGWRDMLANPQEAADIMMKHNKGLDRDVVLAEIAIVGDLVATPDTKAKGLGSIDPALMQASIDLILRTVVGSGAKLSAADLSDASFLPQPPVKP